MQNQAQASEALARSNLYGFLSRVTRSEVDADLLAEFRKPAVQELLTAVGADLSPVLNLPDDKLLLEELAKSYTYTFLFTVNPHGSVQQGEGKLWGDTTVAANRFLEETGLAVEGSVSLLPDHISIELAVMQYLAAEAAAALGVDEKDRVAALQALQIRYLREHLGRWGTQFFTRVAQESDNEFYRIIGRLGSGFLQSEMEAFGL